MQTVTVNVSKSYHIHIGDGLLKQCGELIKSLGNPCRTVIVTDDNVASLYLSQLKQALLSAGFPAPHSYVFPHGEQSKTLAMAEQLYHFFTEHQLTRADLIIALGGGVTGDLTGFAASTYLRGVRYVQIPTTLLAQVDSSVGGKTAVDLPQGKNLVGTFWQPSLVICDVALLTTLSEDIFLDGMAEVLKYGLIRSRGLYELLLAPNNAYRARMAEVVHACVTIKQMIVQNDEFDTGERMLLNFGHTLAHAIELHSGFSVSHGKAVAIGMAMLSSVAAQAGLVDPTLAAEIVVACRVLGLPTTYNAPANALTALCLSDKKRSGDFISIILPKTLGEAIIHKITIDDFSQMVCGGNL